MAIWIVGDVQGCHKPLKRLLERVRFDWSRDVLWSCGDIVNRGPKSLKTLRFFYEHRDAIRLVLGNHDLHLLAVAHAVRAPGRSDTFDEILQAPDREELLSWLQDRPLIYREGGVTMVHAGIPPQWSVEEAEARAREVEKVLQGPDSGAFFETMYGNDPAGWSDDLRGMDRLRVITNYFTRMRYCYPDGRLDLLSKGPLDKPGGPADTDPDLDAWFRHPNRKTAGERMVFGHWASLQGKTDDPNVIGLDTGCVWGFCMTLYNPDTGERVTEPCPR
jgi:bis(5'-nucleosyl)-tetraphosphatase (symmetrical)